jgi:hypothetical protein
MKIEKKELELEVTGIEVAGLVAVTVIVLVIIYVSVTGVGMIINQPAAGPVEDPAQEAEVQEVPG